MNFVCTVFEQGDEMLTLLSMEKAMVECNLKLGTGLIRNTSASNIVASDGPSLWLLST